VNPFTLLENNSTSSDQKICLVTGGAGFIGSHLCEELLRLGFSLIIVDNLSQGKESHIHHLLSHESVQFFPFDITSTSFFSWLELIRVDYAFHLASPVGVSLVMNADNECFSNHFDASKQIIDWAIRTNTTLFFASSSEVYGNPKTDKPIVENEAKEPDWFLDKSNRYRYGLLKRELEIYCENQHLNSSSSINIPRITIGRFFNIFGPRQNPEIGMVIPRFVQAALSNNPIIIIGTGTEIRSFCPVSTAVRFIIKTVMNPLTDFQLLNIGAEQSVQISELAQLIKQFTDSKSEIIYQQAEKESGRNEAIHTRIPDISGLKKICGNTGTQDWKEYLKSWLISEKTDTQRLQQTGVSIGYT
jgi:UDP-glucose 4-epimerase